jgi:hypothetical protein
MEHISTLIVVPVVLAIVVVSLYRLGILGKKMLPMLPESGPLPVAELGQYYELTQPALAWERVRGWELNQAVAVDLPAPIDHVILTPRLLDFCSARTGKLVLEFNFLVGAIETVTFEPGGAPRGSVAPGQGLLTIFTPSGQTRLFATQGFVLQLEQAMANAHRVGVAGAVS